MTELVWIPRRLGIESENGYIAYESSMLYVAWKLYIVVGGIRLPDGISTMRMEVGDKHDKNRRVGTVKDDRNTP